MHADPRPPPLTHLRGRGGHLAAGGFTLLELSIALAIIAVLAGLVVGYERAAARNSSFGGALFELASTAQGLRSEAMGRGQDHLLVVVNAPGDANDCGMLSRSRCTRWFLLRSPTASWTLDGFDPASPGTNAEYVSDETFPRGVTLLSAGPTAPAPFSGMTFADAQLTSSCGGASCFALRFGADGKVRAEFKTGITPIAKAGYLFAMGVTGLSAETPATARRAMLVAFPAGLVQTFPF